MSSKKYNNGQFRSGSGNENRYISSSRMSKESRSSLAIVVSVILLAIITAVFIREIGDESVGAWSPSDPTTTSTSATTTIPVLPPMDDNKYPYATVTDKTQFVASAGGEGIYGLDISSGFAILVRLSDMSTLAHKYADELIYPASMTKIMTVVAALDMIEDLEDGYVITREVLSQVPSDASTAWLSSYKGKTVSVRDLLYGITYMSGADSVLCLIDYLDLSVSEFVSLMNEKADEIGMENTHFGGAIGMDTENNTTTCRDIAALMAYAMENPLCRELFGGTSYRLDYIDVTYYNSTLSKTLVTNMGTNADNVLGKNYTLLAAKSGLEDKAGYCLASYIRNDVTGELFVLVTAKAERSSDYPPNKNTIIDMMKIIDSVQP